MKKNYPKIFSFFVSLEREATCFCLLGSLIFFGRERAIIKIQGKVLPTWHDEVWRGAVHGIGPNSSLLHDVTLQIGKHSLKHQAAKWIKAHYAEKSVSK